MRVLGISGSLRKGSYNQQLVRTAAGLLPDDVEFELFGDLKVVEPYDEDDDGEATPPGAARARAAIAAADALIIATPEYNSSIPGQLKNAVDWASRPVNEGALKGKTVAVVGASKGAFGAVWAQAELRKVLAASGARVVEGEVAVGHAHERFDGDGRLIDTEAVEQLGEVVDALVASTRETELLRAS
jgi:chromate reductase